jgi:hypothetical protein
MVKRRRTLRSKLPHPLPSHHDKAGVAISQNKKGVWFTDLWCPFHWHPVSECFSGSWLSGKPIGGIL